MISQKTQNNKAFTLVETMIAVFILSISIVSFMGVVTNSLFAAKYARDEITANYLLQEAIDFIRNDRDTKVLLGSTPWSTFVSNYKDNCKNDSTSYCYIDVLDIAGGPKVGTPKTIAKIMLYDPNATTTPYYNYTTGGVSRFKRTIVVTSPTVDEMDVLVTVTWKNGGLQKNRTLTTKLTNWQSL